MDSFAVSSQFPQPLQCLFKKKRYKVLYGGRGAGRSWGAARALLLIGAQRPTRVLCAREFQNSIAESVHKLLADQIVELGLGDKYWVEVGRIYGPNGTTFSFEGIKNNTSKIKSYEGIDYCWVEEANKVSESSWETLIPTIRKEEPKDWRERGMERPDWQSEIWMTFNPELETDYTFDRFVTGAGDSIAQAGNCLETADSYVVKMTWRDNPWFPEVLRKEMLVLRARDYDAYLNIWEGFPRQILEGAVYARELRAAQLEGRIIESSEGGVPWDRETPVDCFWDLGKRDLTSIWFAQRVALQNRILAYYEGRGLEVHDFLQELQRRRYTYGTMYLPHDARAKRLGSKRTIQEQIAAAGYKVRIIPKQSINDGINAARMIFPTCWFDAKRCETGLSRLRHYRYSVKDGQLSNDPKHDDNSNGADAWRYLALALRSPQGGDRAVGVMERLSAAMRERLGREDSAPPGDRWMGQ